METKHVITQGVGSTAALLVIAWGWREFRRDWREHQRVPLVTGPHMGGRTVLGAFAVIAALVPLLYAILKFELVPRQSVPLFVAMLAWTAGTFFFASLGLTVIVARRAAKGWLTLIGADTVRIDAEGASVTLRLGPGAARLSFVLTGGGPQYVQLDLEGDAGTRAHVWGMLGLRDLKLVSPGHFVQPQGLMAATSLGPLCRRLAPYLASSEDAPPTRG
ncbi:MAG TPA: hypothetical protein VHU40_06705 [Polyangia bacterium]|jgi:hypothetical protein|nr:hypothetical protein [Polyangia bacterium]